MSVISICNPKGGTGKTTLALVLAEELSRNGAKVSVIDADPNAVVARWAAKREQDNKALPYNVITRPSEGAMISTITARDQEDDFVIIDLEGAATRMTTRALARSHLVLVPYNESAIDAELAATAVQIIYEEEEVLSRKIPFRLVRSRINAAIATKTSQRITASIAEAELPLLKTGLVERSAYRDIYEFGALLSEITKDQNSGIAKARDNATALASEIIAVLKEEYPA